MTQQTYSEGRSFTQRGGARNKQLPPHDKNIWKICNTPDAYRRVTHHHISQKKLPILRIKKKVMMANISRVNQSSTPQISQ